MPLYNWQHRDWPNFIFDHHQHQHKALWYADAVNFLCGKLAALPVHAQFTSNTETIVTEALYSSWIEGENLRIRDLKSSVLNTLDPKVKNRHVSDDRAAGIGRLLAINRKTTNVPLNEVMLLEWHRIMFEKAGGVNVVGGWRLSKKPMEIVSGPFGKEEVHFRAPPSAEVPRQMAAYLNWHTNSSDKFAAAAGSVIRAAISHVYFESVHPFEDGNGRIGRAVAEKILAQPLLTALPFSLSAAIAADSKAYYSALNEASRTLVLDNWIAYFINTCLKAVELGGNTLDFTVFKGHYLADYAQKMNKHQRKAIDKMLDAGYRGFEGGMSARKYVGITRVSRATATRDLQKLVGMGALVQEGAGRSVRYRLPNTSS